MKRLIICGFLACCSFYILQAQTYQQWVEKSVEYIECNMPDSAEVTLKNALKLDPANENNAALLMSLGVIQRQLGKLEDAYVSFTSAIPDFPEKLIVLHNRASLLCDMNRFDEAMVDYNAIIRLDPDNLEAYYRRGLLFLEQHERTKAETDFIAARRIDPEHPYSLLSEALIYKLDNNWSEAVKVYTKLIDNSETPLSGYFMNRAECYVYMGEIFKASADLRVAEPNERNNPYFYFLRGRVRLDQYDKTAARTDFTKAKDMGYDPEISEEWIAKTK